MINPEAAEFYKRGWMDCLRTMYKGDELRQKFTEMFDQWIFDPDVKDTLNNRQDDSRAMPMRALPSETTVDTEVSTPTPAQPEQQKQQEPEGRQSSLNRSPEEFLDHQLSERLLQLY